MAGERPRATLSDKQSRGGVIGGKGYGFQAAYIVSRIPLWLADPDFVQFLQEGAGDVDVRFDRAEGEERWYVQVKNYLVKPATARDVLTQFRETDEGSLDTYTHFTLACPGLHDRLKQLRAAVEDLRGAAPFFRHGKDPILDNTWADLEQLVERLNLPVDAAFLLDKVHFDTDLAGLRDDDSLRRLFVGSLVELEGWAGMPSEAATRAYEKLALRCHQALRETYTRGQVESIIQAAVEEVVPPRVISDVCPYQGLDAFTEAEAEFFFGRQDVVNRFVERLKREPRFLAVLGPSGSGKSSLVQAGLIPRLRTGAVPGSDRWGIIVTRPTDHPFHELQAQGLMGAGDGLIEAVRAWLDDHPEQTRLMLVVDQFEELLVTSPQALRRSFVTQLIELLDTGLPVTVVLTMRDDFYGRLGREAPALLAWLERGLVNVPLTLSRDDLRNIVEKPAQAVGLVFEPGLVDAILDGAIESTPQAEGRTGRSTVLPLLEFALTQLWERQRERSLTHEAYEAIGGVTGGLTQWADRTLHGLEKEKRQLARRVLTDLVHMGDESQGLPDSRRRRLLADLCRNEEEIDAVHQVVQRLTDTRLLATGRELESGRETVELIHDALLREWGLLQRWLAEDRRFLAWRQDLERQAQAWEESGPGPGRRRENERLLRGRALAEAERWLVERGDELRESAKQFIRTSAARVKRGRRLVLGVAVLTFLMISMFALLAGMQRSAALQQARVARAGELAAQSQAVLEEYPQRSLLLAVEALNVTLQADEPRTSMAEQVLRDALRQAGGHPLAGHESSISNLAFSPDGRWLVTGSRDATARLWDLAAPDPAANPTVLRGHEDWITSLAFSPDGRWLATGSRDATARLWDLMASDPAANPTVLRGHEGTVLSLAFSPDGRWLVTDNRRDAIARLWDLATSDPAANPIVLRGHRDDVTSLAFSPDGRWLATGSLDATARMWDLLATDPAANPIVLRGHEGGIIEGGINSLAFSPDGRWLATESWDETAWLWDLATSDPAANPIVLEGGITSLAFSPDGRWLATNSGDATARMWDLTATDPAYSPIVLRGHEGTVVSLAFSPDGRWLATGGWDDPARLWDLATSDPAANPIVLRGHEDRITSLAFSPDGRWLATESWDETAWLWDLAATDPAANPIVLQGHEGNIDSLAFSPDGRWLVTGSSDETARLWDVSASDPVANPIVFRGHEDWITSLAFSPDGRWLATGGWDNTARLWDVLATDPAANPIVLDGVITSLAFSPDGRWLAIGSWDNTAWLWDVLATDPAADPIVLRGHEGNIDSLAFSPDGRWLTTGSWDGTARMWDLVTSDPAADPIVLRGYEGGINEGGINSLAFSPDGRWLVTGSSDETAWLWGLAATNPAANPIVLEGGITSLAFSPDGRWLATDSGDATARLWDVLATDPAADPIVLRGHEGNINSLAFSPDGRWLATGSWDNTARLWDVLATDPAANPIVLRGHEDRITSLAFSPDGRWLATGGWDGTARMWDLAATDPAANPIVLQGHEGRIWSLAFSPDGRWLATGDDATARLWALRLTELMDLSCRTAGRNLTRSEWRQYFPGEPYHPTCPDLPVPPEE